MAATKTYTSPTTFGVNGITATTTSSWVDLSGGYGATVNLSIVNGATGPTTAGQFQVQVADNYNAGSPTLIVNFGGPLVGSTANSGSASWPVEIPIGIEAVRVVYTAASTPADSTATADVSNVTGI